MKFLVQTLNDKVLPVMSSLIHNGKSIALNKNNFGWTFKKLTDIVHVISVHAGSDGKY